MRRRKHGKRELLVKVELRHQTRYQPRFTRPPELVKIRSHPKATDAAVSFAPSSLLASRIIFCCTLSAIIRRILHRCPASMMILVARKAALCQWSKMIGTRVRPCSYFLQRTPRTFLHFHRVHRHGISTRVTGTRHSWPTCCVTDPHRMMPLVPNGRMGAA